MIVVFCISDILILIPISCILLQVFFAVVPSAPIITGIITTSCSYHLSLTWILFLCTRPSVFFFVCTRPSVFFFPHSHASFCIPSAPFCCVTGDLIIVSFTLLLILYLLSSCVLSIRALVTFVRSDCLFLCCYD